MHKAGGTARRVIVGIGLVTLLASCAFGVTKPATDVTDSSALLTGVVRNTITGPTEYWFDYGHTVCARDADGRGVCGEDQSFATVGDSVTGSGTVFVIPELGYAIGASFDASSGADGSAPSGTASFSPGSFYFRFPDTGPVTCLRIDGNRATVGFVAQPLDFGDPNEQPIPELLFVEDNGAMGDRLGMQVVATPATTCPAATAADFVNFDVGGFAIPRMLTTGDFVIHDTT